MVRSDEWDQRVQTFLAARMRGNPRAEAYYRDLWRHHLETNLAGEHFVIELTNGDDGKFAQRVWEMHLGRHLVACGLAITSAPEGEPDFCFVRDGQVVWVEAVSPTPGPDLPQSWLKHDLTQTGGRVETVPHEAMLLRWTTAFDAKVKQGIKYRRDGVIKDGDAYVIAIDGNQLSKTPMSHGSSHRPYVLEVALAIGPVAFAFDKDSGRFRETEQTLRFAVAKKNGSLVATEPFFRPENAGVSAVLGCCPPMFGEPILPIQIAYNPLAVAPLTPGILGQAAEEYVAMLRTDDDNGQEWELTRLTPHENCDTIPARKKIHIIEKIMAPTASFDPGTEERQP